MNKNTNDANKTEIPQNSFVYIRRNIIYEKWWNWKNGIAQRFFLWGLLTALHPQHAERGKTIEQGQFSEDFSTLERTTKLTTSQIVEAAQMLQACGVLTYEMTVKHIIVTFTDYKTRYLESNSNTN